MAEKDVFWADKLASQVLQRGENPVVRSATSPSGAKHIGNLFDVMKGYMVYKALKRKGARPSFVLVHDDRDPLRTLPSKVPDIDGKWADVKGDIEKLMKDYIGHPYSAAPDPFGCHETWALHFSKVWENGIIASGVGENEINFISSNDMYLQGRFDPYFHMIFENLKGVRKVISQFQDNVTDDYVPVLAICENCGKIIGKVNDFNLEEKLVGYSCEGRELAGKYKVEGCGHAGKQSWRNCKLAWRFEWPAQWAIFKTTPNS